MICREDIDQKAPAYSPRSPALDHIVPMAIGGEHRRHNVQCAHFSCNAEKARKEIKAIAKVKRIQKRERGEERAKRKILSRPFTAWRGLSGQIRRR